MIPNSAIATMTLARNAEESDLLIKGIEALSVFDMPVYVTDGGSTEEFTAKISSFKNIHVLPPKTGLWSQIHQSLQTAFTSGVESILYTEPDKLDFFQKHLSGWLQKTTQYDPKGILMAGRTSEAFSSFPSFQQYTESTINRCCEEMIKESLDFVYGPFLLNKNIIPHLNNLPSEIGWGWRSYSFGIAKRLGYKVGEIQGEFNCPGDQRVETEKDRIYRMKQMVQNVEGLLLSAQAVIDPHFAS